jgi:effector-binding domain-containing protein
MSYDVEVFEKSEQYALTVRKIVSFEDLPEELGKGYKLIADYLDEINKSPSDVPFAVYHNTHMDKIDVEFGYPVAMELKGKGDIKDSKTPSGLVASCVYKGSYTKMEPVYEEITSWIKDNNYKPTGVVFENYLNDPQVTPSEELLTRIGFILKKTI